MSRPFSEKKSRSIDSKKRKPTQKIISGFGDNGEQATWLVNHLLSPAGRGYVWKEA